MLGRDIHWAGVKKFLASLYREWDADNVEDVAAALTFSGVLALFPFLLFLVALTSLMLDPSETAELIAQLYQVAPSAVAEILSERLDALGHGGSPGLLTLGGIGAFWAASGGVAALSRALNAAYDVTETRPWWKVRLLGIGVTAAAAVLSVIAAAIAIVTPAVVNFLGLSGLSPLFLFLRLPIAAFIMMIVLAMLYYVLPNAKMKFRIITPGSVVAVLLWLLVSVGFSSYVTNFGSYEVTYGALGGVIVMLMWMWISSMAIMLGAEINSLIERRGEEKGAGTAKTELGAMADAPEETAAKKAKSEASARQLAPTPATSRFSVGALSALAVGFLLGRRRAGPR
nr:YihY/virulence factor BrkB family protein [Chondromyces apiculatus]